jgi:hypothetical protein
VKNSYLKVAAVVAAMAVTIPAAAMAKPDNKPAKPDKPTKVKLVTVNLRGIVTANDGTTVTVTVDKVSGQAKVCKGKSLMFSASKLHVADNDADGDQDLADVLVGHRVKVQGKAPKGAKGTCGVPEGQALAAKQIHDLTTPETAEADEQETEA